MVVGATIPDVAGAVEEAARLAARLDVRLRYHDARHTFDEVLPAAMDLAHDLDVPRHDRGLLETAAAWHDLGFLETRAGHEMAAMAMVREHLPGFGFSEEDVERIAGMILATRLPQWPRTPLERILADADLSVLASDAFLARNDDLRIETSLFGRWRPNLPWWIEQRSFLLHHVDHTRAACDRYSAARRRNADALLERQRAFLAAAA